VNSIQFNSIQWGQAASCDANHAHQLLGAVAALHGRGISHRDIKLDNMVLDAQGAVRLIDFESAIYAAPDEGGLLQGRCDSCPPHMGISPKWKQGQPFSSSECDTAMGTPAYLPPELVWAAQAMRVSIT
jgi:serine/threonine protein kinase